MIWIVLVVVAVLAASVVLFLHSPRFGCTPRWERLARIECSPHYHDGEFHNLHPTGLMVSRKGFVQSLMEFLFRKDEGLRPDTPLVVSKRGLEQLKADPAKDALVWFGHSSYLMQLGGKRFLVDPVFYMASPVSFANKPFLSTDSFKPAEMPDIDYLIITHDHWDHLDYETVTELKERIGKVICPLGVGEHFEYWGFDTHRIIELDWEEQAELEKGFTVYCLPARHFSGRGLKRNVSLWASFLIDSPARKVYVGGDGGYDSHYLQIGRRFPDIDWAIMENGQYNEDWRYIHLMPAYMAKAAKELKAKHILTVHHSKYALSTHRWDEPLRNAQAMRDNDSLQVAIPKLGESLYLETEADTVDVSHPDVQE